MIRYAHLDDDGPAGDLPEAGCGAASGLPASYDQWRLASPSDDDWTLTPPWASPARNHYTLCTQPLGHDGPCVLNRKESR